MILLRKLPVHFQIIQPLDPLQRIYKINSMASFGRTPSGWNQARGKQTHTDNRHQPSGNQSSKSNQQFTDGQQASSGQSSARFKQSSGNGLTRSGQPVGESPQFNGVQQHRDGRPSSGRQHTSGRYTNGRPRTDGRHHAYGRQHAVSSGNKSNLCQQSESFQQTSHPHNVNNGRSVRHNQPQYSGQYSGYPVAQYHGSSQHTHVQSGPAWCQPIVRPVQFYGTTYYNLANPPQPYQPPQLYQPPQPYQPGSIPQNGGGNQHNHILQQNGATCQPSGQSGQQRHQPRVKGKSARRRYEYVGEESRTKRQAKQGQHSIDIKVVSYNVLSDYLQNSHPELYVNCPRSALPFKNRKHRIIKSILYHDPTIICLQEVDDSHFTSFYLSELRQYGYEGQYIKRTDVECTQHDGVAIFFKTDELKLLDCEKVEYYVPECWILNRGNVGMVMSFQPINYKQRRLPRRLCIANTHLLFNMNRGDVKLAQLSYLLAHLHKAAQKPDEPAGTYYPTFLCGDFNSTPFSHLYNFLTSGRISYTALNKRSISGQIKKQFYGADMPGNILPPFLRHDCTFSNDSSIASVPPPSTRHAGRHVRKDTEASTQKVKQLKISPEASTDADHYLAFPTTASHVVDPPPAETGQRPEGSQRPSQPGGSGITSPPEHSRVKSPPGGSGDTIPQKLTQGELTHKFKFNSAYLHDRIGRLFPRLVPEVTTSLHTDGEADTVDYIFYTPNACSNCSSMSKSTRRPVTSVCTVTLLSRYGLLSAEELPSIPNHTEPSDHLLLVAEFRIQSV